MTTTQLSAEIAGRKPESGSLQSHLRPSCANESINVRIWIKFWPLLPTWTQGGVLTASEQPLDRLTPDHRGTYQTVSATACDCKARNTRCAGPTPPIHG